MDLTVVADDGRATTLEALRRGRPAVVDFWTTRCGRCPACLSKLNAMAKEESEVAFLAVCLDAPATAAPELEKTSSASWEAMTHAFADLETKEKFKAHWGFKYVPYVVVVDKHGSTFFHGSGAGLEPETIRAALASCDKENSTRPNLAFDHDDDF
ncbi:hypothetical protein CTAYLR_007783 [Chrysophaeum taylorii]|uniref:Thioredoxin domain-containing protein n=1 Tax=Chrysophaeum taylorii TaxID=2483200 RepID=A0AAD7UJ04_9STRA|nr:hypothetical protein CTAYLR_007783 [Chrysophaeum taylorii]